MTCPQCRGSGWLPLTNGGTGRCFCHIPTVKAPPPRQGPLNEIYTDGDAHAVAVLRAKAKALGFDLVKIEDRP